MSHSPDSPSNASGYGGPASETPHWKPLGHRERRLLGVLIEKAKTTPEQYPLTANSLTSGCNQKSNRDPVVNFDTDDILDLCADLQKIGVVSEVVGSGRVSKFRHHAYEWLGVNVQEIAIMAELLLRGPQTIGELRQRAARMEPLGSLEDVTALVRGLVSRKLMVELTPPGRGQIVTHNLYPAEELARIRARQGSEFGTADPAPASRPASAPNTVTATPEPSGRTTPGSGQLTASSPGPVTQSVPASAAPPAAASPNHEAALAQLRQTIDTLREVIDELQDDVRGLRSRLEEVENLVR